LILFLLDLLLMGYLTLGYPLLTLWMAVARPHPSVARDITPSVTLIIPAFNEAAAIAEKLDSVLALTYPRGQLQVLVADDGSDDGTADIVRDYQVEGVELLSYASRRGEVTVMNETVLQAEGETVIYTDADVHCPPDSLQRIVRHFADTSVGCV